MRELRFRAWNGRAMEYSGFCIHATGALIKDSSLGDVFSESAVMQYTGLKDKNGKEVYEGDIIKCRMNFEGGTLPHAGEIVYSEMFPAFATRNTAGDTLIHNHLLNTFEVVGNKFQNPELLKGEL